MEPHQSTRAGCRAAQPSSAPTPTAELHPPAALCSSQHFPKKADFQFAKKVDYNGLASSFSPQNNGNQMKLAKIKCTKKN
jgi:hypothetical protein